MSDETVSCSGLQRAPGLQRTPHNAPHMYYISRTSRVGFSRLKSRLDKAKLSVCRDLKVALQEEEEA